MEGLGKKLQEARLARNLTLDEAATHDQDPAEAAQDIEKEDFSEFASLAYAKGFLLIYGKFLNVDVTPYLEAFETFGERNGRRLCLSSGQSRAETAPCRQRRRRPSSWWRRRWSRITSAACHRNGRVGRSASWS